MCWAEPGLSVRSTNGSTNGLGVGSISKYGLGVGSLSESDGLG